MSDLSGSTIETTDTSSVEVPKPENEPKLSELEQVEALLSGKQPERAPDTAPGREPAAAKESETDADADPETDDPDAKTVDYTQEIPLSNGTKVTLGALKDAYQAFDTKELALIERENNVMSRNRELQELAQYLDLPPQKRAEIQRNQAEFMREQHTLMLDAIPEWKDQAAFEKGRAAIFQLGKEYRVDLSQIADHGAVKLLYDYHRLREAVKAAKATVKAVKTTEPKAIPRQVQHKASELSNAVATAKRTGNIADQLSAVDMLIKG